MRSALLLLAATLVSACAARAPVPDVRAATPASTAPDADLPAAGRLPRPPPGYLAQGAFDLLQVLPRAPSAGDARDEADRRIFRETRALQGSPRWLMASDDANLGADAMLGHFACSLELEVTRQEAPRLVQLLQRATGDAAASMLKAKDYYQRRRPYHVDAGEICRPRAELGTSFDYPSGHATAGWMWALILAEVDPEHATRLLARGRAIGDSRIACGVHNASAVEGGRLTATAVFAAVSSLPEFRADLDAGRAELIRLRAASGPRPDAANCAAERALVDMPLGGGP